MKNKFIILALFIVTLPLFSSVLFKNVSPESSGTDESNVSTNTVSIVKSMEEINIDVKISNGPVTVSSILSNESRTASVLIYRPDSELNVIPSYISPSKVIVDVYDT